MHSVAQDIRFALRQLGRSPGFAGIAILTLALGIGATTAMVTIVAEVLLQPLPYPHQGELVGLDFEQPGQPAFDEQTGESADFLLTHATSFSSMGVADDGASAQNFSTGHGQPYPVRSLRVSSGYLPTLGVAPVLGRTFSREEDAPGAAPTVVLSESLWRNALGGDPSIVGRVIHLNADSYTVLGVMPSALATMDSPDLWQPLHLSPADPGYQGDNFQMIARLRPGAALPQASAELSALNAAFYRAFPSYNRWTRSGAPKLRLTAFPLREVVASHARSGILSLAAAAFALLLLICINLGALLIARSVARERDLALRIALGASRSALVRLLLTENVLLAAAGGVLGAALSFVLIPLLLRTAPIDLPQLHAYRADVRTLAIAIALGALALLLFGVLPSLRALRSAFANATNTRASTAGVAAQRLGKALLVSQVALTSALLSIAALLLGTFLNIRTIHTGVRPARLYAAQVHLHGNSFRSAAKTQQFIAAVERNLQGNAAIASVSAVNGLPLDRGLNNGGYPAGHPEQAGLIETRFVTPGYFTTVGTDVLAGQDVSASDTSNSAPVALINARAATLWFGAKPVIGEFVVSGGGEPRRVIGVVENVRGQEIADAARPTVYIPFAQIDDETAGTINGWFPTTFVVSTRASRGADDAQSLLHAVTGAITSADPEVAVSSFLPMQHYFDKSVAAPRFFSSLAMALSLFAVLLTLLGTFGLLSHQVSSRTREFGVRMALGSTRAGVLLLVLRRGLLLTATGLLFGFLLSLSLRQAVRSFFYLSLRLGPDSLADVLASPYLAFAAAAGSLLLAALLASLLPARRAASINPTDALRTE